MISVLEESIIFYLLEGDYRHKQILKRHLGCLRGVRGCTGPRLSQSRDEP